MAAMLGSRVLIATLVALLLPGSPIARADTISAASHMTSSGGMRPNATLTPDGYGDIRIGSRLSDLRGYTPTNASDPSQSCYVTELKEAPGLSLLASYGTIRRISLHGSSKASIRTDRGIGIGSTEAQVRRVYRPLDIRPHQYDEAPASYLTWLNKGGKRGLVFETGPDRRVDLIHAGLMPELGYIENCG